MVVRVSGMKLRLNIKVRIMRKLVSILFLLVVSVSFSQQVQIYYDLHLTVGFVPSGALTTQIQGPCTRLDEVYMNSDVTLRGSSLCSDSLPYVFYIGLTRENSSGADDEGYVTINSVGESKSIHLEVNDGGAIHSLDVTFYVLDMMSLQDPVKLSCEEIQINATQGHPLEAYNWQFQALSDQWQDVPIQQNQDNITVSLNDLYGANANSYLNTPINFRIHNQYNNYYSNTKSYVFTDCSPGLVQDPPTPIPPTCSDSNDGSVQIQFDRSLASNERTLIYLENQETDGAWSTYGNSYILDSSDINGTNSNTYVWDPVLVPNTYRLRYVSKYDVTNIDPTPDPSNPNSDEMSQPFTITAPSPVSLVYSKEDVLCHGANTGSITVTASGGSGLGYQYSKDKGATWQSSNVFSDLIGNSTYNLLVQDSNACILQTAMPVFIDEPDLEFSIQALDIVNPSANGSIDGSIKLFVTGGTGDLLYTWLKDGVNYATTVVEDLTGLGAGEYQVTATDENGCSSNTLTIPLVDPPPLSIDFTVIQAIDCNGTTGGIRAQGIGGNGTSYTYTWQDGTTGQDLLNVPAGTYTVTVTDANSVSVTDSFELTQPEAINVTDSQTDVSCFGVSDGSLSLTISGGVEPYSITWTDNNTITTTDRNGLPQGDYYYTITDSNGCTISGSVSVAQPTALEIIVDNMVNPTIVGGSDGSIEVSVSGGTPGYTYQWTDGSGSTIATTEDISNLIDGNYTLLVTDANGCAATISQRVSEPQPLSATILEANPISCVGGNDGALTADPIGGSNSYSYEWFRKDGGGYTSLGVITQTVTGLVAGSYRVLVTDSAGATAQSDYTLNDPAPIVVTVSLQHINCYGGSDGAIDIAVAGGTAPYTFSWTNSAGTTVGTDEDISSLPSGSYSIFVIDANGCTAIANFELTEPAESLWITLDTLTDPSLAGGTDGAIAVTVTGGTPPYTYEWTDSSGTVISTDEDVSGLGEGVYRLTVYDANSTVTSDNSGCIVVDDFALLAPDALVVIIDEEQSNLCNGDITGILVATGAGGYLNTNSAYNYQWFKEENGTFIDLGQTSYRITGLSAGNYRVVITDDNGSTASDTYLLDEPSVLSITLTVASEVSCTSGADGAIDALVQGGTPPYTYSWSNGASSEDIDNLGVGSYSLSVTDRNGCTTWENVEVSQPGGMEITSSAVPPACNGGNDGSVSLNVSAGNPPYSYLWNTGATTASVDNLGAGNYNVTVTDNAGCKSVLDFILADPNPLVLDLGKDRVLCSGQSYLIDATIDDPGADYQWTADNGFASISPIVELSEAGEYTLIITNSNGCTAQDSILITTISETVSADFLVPTQAFVGETIVVVDVSDPIPDTIEWEFSDGTNIVEQNQDYAEISFDKEGAYTVTMTSFKGSCQAEMTKEIIVQSQAYADQVYDSESPFIKEFKVYPNPNNGVFEVQVTLAETSAISIKIINLGNNAIVNSRIANGDVDYLLAYDLNTAIGAYLVLLETPKGAQVRKMIIN